MNETIPENNSELQEYYLNLENLKGKKSHKVYGTSNPQTQIALGLLLTQKVGFFTKKVDDFHFILYFYTLVEGEKTSSGIIGHFHTKKKYDSDEIDKIMKVEFIKPTNQKVYVSEENISSLPFCDEYVTFKKTNIGVNVWL